MSGIFNSLDSTIAAAVTRAIEASPNNYNAYGVTYFAPYVLMGIMVLGAYILYKDYWRRKDAKDDEERKEKKQALKELNDTVATMSTNLMVIIKDLEIRVVKLETINGHK